ncbi:MAG: hypothetical protein AAGG99_03955 [Pseudomonadota bacterium]
MRMIRGLLEGIWSIAQPVVRAFGWLFALAAATAFIAQTGRAALAPGTDTPATNSMHAWSLLDHWQRLAPDSLAAAIAAIETATAPFVWDPVLSTLLGQPMWLTFAVLAAVLLFLSRRRNRISVFAN